MSLRPAVVLAVETSAQPGSIALLAHGNLRERALGGDVPGPSLLVELDTLLASEALALGDVELFACGVGPGAFTGLRVGLATVKALAYALSRGVVGVPSLEAHAARARARLAREGLLVPILDARRGEVYAAAFDEKLDRVLEERARPPEVLGEELRALGRPILAFGGGANLFAARIGVEPIVDDALLSPGAAEIATLAAARAHLAATGPALFDLSPRYVRPADAELSVAARR